MKDYSFLFEDEEIVLERKEHENSPTAKKKAVQKAAAEEKRKIAKATSAKTKPIARAAKQTRRVKVKRIAHLKKAGKIGAGVALGAAALGVAGKVAYDKMKKNDVNKEGMTMNKRNIKAIVLEHWFGIDRILFGGNLAKNVLEGDAYQKYVTSKGCILSNLFELYNKISFEPDLPEFETVNDILESAGKRASVAKETTKALLEKADVSKVIRDEIKEYGDSQGLTEGQVAKLIVSRKFKAAAIDSMLLEEAVQTSCKLCLSDWKSKVLLDAHKVMRDTLIEASEEVNIKRNQNKKS